MSTMSVRPYDIRAIADDAAAFRSRTRGRLALALLALLVALVVAGATAGTAAAHATVVSSTPAANAVLKEAPTSVKITFAEDLSPAGSDIVVYDATMKQVSIGQAEVDRTDLKNMSVPMQGNDSEVYVVVWHNSSADDGDPDAGSFVFNIGTPSNDATPGDGSGANSPASGPPTLLVALLSALVGLLVGGAGTVFVLRRGSGRP